MTGWIKISRDIVNHWIYKNEKWRLWWFDLLLMAAWEDRETEHDSHTFILKRGQIVASINDLSKRWGVSNPTVIKFLKSLENVYMLDRQILYRQTPVITICNYDKYQLNDSKRVDKQVYRLVDKQVYRLAKEDKEISPHTPFIRKEENNNITNKENKEPPYNPPKGYEIFDFSFVEEEYKKPFCQWLDYKRERKEKYKTQKSIELAYSKMKKLSDNNPETAMMIVEESMANNWQGLFALKNNPPEKKGMDVGVILKERPKYTKGW